MKEKNMNSLSNNILEDKIKSNFQGNNFKKNKDNPFFTIIIPAYNCEQTISNSINSILIQKFNDYEIIIVDDGSIDKTRKIIENFKSKYDYIKVFHQKNSGPFVARQKGIKNAEGKYLLFLDSDDIFINDSLEKIADIITKNNLDFLSFSYITNGLQKNKKYKQIFNNNQIISDKNQLVFELYVRDSSFKGLSNKCVINNKFDFNSIPKHAKSLKSGEDYLMSFELFKNVSRAMFIEDVYYQYNFINQNSLTSTKKISVWINELIEKDNIMFNLLEKSKMLSHENKKIFIENSLMKLDNLIRISVKSFKIKKALCIIEKLSINNYVQYILNFNIEKKDNLLLKLFKKRSFNLLIFITKLYNLRNNMMGRKTKKLIYE